MFLRRLLVTLWLSGATIPNAIVPVQGFSIHNLRCNAGNSLIRLNSANDPLRQADISDVVPNRSFSALLTAALIFGSAPFVGASEIGVEVEAPTFISGETVEICTKRGPLGACLKTELRTERNDNDIAKKYFRDPSDIIKQREAAMRAESDEGNALIQKLRQQSIDNAEKNNLLVQRKTFENDQSATFGPFDRQVLILNTDGRTYTLLQNPQAMRLKKAGFIDDRRQFIKQPTQDDIEKALESDGFFADLFGG